MDNISLNRGLIATLCKEIFADISELKNVLPKAPEKIEKETVDRLAKLSKISETARLRGLSKIFDVLSKAGESFVNTVPDQNRWDVFLRCFRSLQNHLQEIVYEHKNTPITLSRPLYNLMQSVGMDVSPALAGELFMPYIPYDFGAKARPTQIDSDAFSQAVHEHKTAYHEALEKLVKNNDMNALNTMRQSLVTLEPKNPHSAFRLFFDSSIAFFDRLIKVQQLDNLSKWIVGRIEGELSRLVKKEEIPHDNILSAILYVVAQAEPQTAIRIRKIQDHYGLSQYIADPNGVDPAVMEKFLNVLIKAREMWTHAVSTGSLQEFKRLIQEMHQKASYLKNSGFALISETMNQLTDFETANPGRIDKQVLSLEGASALLIMEQQVREGSNMELAKSSSNKILVLMGKEVAAKDESADGSVGGRQRYSVLYRLAEEISVDLGGIEQNLLDFLSGNLDVQEDMMASLKKVENVLFILSDSLPGKIVQEFTKLVKIPENKEDRELLANGFAHLTGMVELLKSSESSAIDAAKKAIQILCPEVQDFAVKHPAEEMVVVGNVDVPNDKDLLDIFMEETTEILASLKNDLSELSSHPSDKELLTRVRRSYHTLKGSGRMVGLKHFGEASWAVEDTLNRWMKTKTSASDDLVDFLNISTNLISIWVDSLKSTGMATIDYSEIERQAQIFQSGGTPSQSAAPKPAISMAPVASEALKELNFIAEPDPTPMDVPSVESILELVSGPETVVEIVPEPIVEIVSHPAEEFALPVVEIVPEPVVEVISSSIASGFSFELVASEPVEEVSHPAEEFALPVIESVSEPIIEEPVHISSGFSLEVVEPVNVPENNSFVLEETVVEQNQVSSWHVEEVVTPVFSQEVSSPEVENQHPFNEIVEEHVIVSEPVKVEEVVVPHHAARPIGPAIPDSWKHLPPAPPPKQKKTILERLQEFFKSLFKR